MLATPSIQGGGGIEVQGQSRLPETPYQKVKQKLKSGSPDQGSHGDQKTVCEELILPYQHVSRGSNAGQQAWRLLLTKPP